MITQFADVPTHDGVVKGAFHAPGVTDLAVLCHRGAHEVVYLFWGRSSEISDSIFSGGYDPGGELYRASPSYIIEHIVNYGTEVPEFAAGQGSPAYQERLKRIITHDGLGLTVGECCSSVLYWMNRSWIGLPGAD